MVDYSWWEVKGTVKKIKEMRKAFYTKILLHLYQQILWASSIIIYMNSRLNLWTINSPNLSFNNNNECLTLYKNLNTCKIWSNLWISSPGMPPKCIYKSV